MTFEEKSAWGLLVGILIIAWYYFPAAFAVAAGSAGGTALIAVSVGGVVALIVIEVVYHAIIAATGPGERDERDALINLKAERIGGVALGVGLFSLVGYIVAQSITGVYPVPSALEIAVWILFVLTLSEVAKLGSQIVYYRLGI